MLRDSNWVLSEHQQNVTPNDASNAGLFSDLIVGFSILLRVYSQSQIKPPYATQYSYFLTEILTIIWVKAMAV
jgi:hypothetical protein